jgi:hypothetical protein
MKTKEEISSYLQKVFCSVYCYNCKYDMQDNICDECARKSMNWGLDSASADLIAEEILKEEIIKS